MNDFDWHGSDETWSVEDNDFARVLALSDGVFAFALTLLAVNLTLPSLEAQKAANELPAALWNMRGVFALYGLAFLIVYSKWNAHRRLVRILRRYDRPLLTLNMLFLFFVAAIPLPAWLIGTWGSQPAAVIFFAGYMASTTLVQLVMWLYATRGHRLIAPEVPDEWLRLNTIGTSIIVLIFAGSIPLALWNTSVAEYSWLLLLLVSLLAPRVDRLLAR